MTEARGDVEVVACGLCGAQDARLLLIARDRRFRVDGVTYSLRRCAGCGHVFLSPRPSPAALGRYYPRAFYAPRLSEAAVDTPKNLEKLAILTRSTTRPGFLLDVGCAAGDFLEIARAQGWRVAGVDFDEDVSAWVRRTRGIPVTTGSIESVEIPRGLTACTFWASLEHLPDPALALRRVQQALLPDGVVIILVPNFESWEAKWAGVHWPHLDIPRHLHHFTPATLGRLLRDSGFSNVSVETPKTELAATHWPSVLLRGWAPTSRRARRAFGRLLAPLSSALTSAAASAGRNHTLLAIARR